MSSSNGRRGTGNGPCALSRRTTRSSAPSGSTTQSSRRTACGAEPGAALGGGTGGRGRAAGGAHALSRPRAHHSSSPGDREAIRALAEDIPALCGGHHDHGRGTQADRAAAAGAGRGHGGRGIGERRGGVSLGRRACRAARAGPLGAPHRHSSSRHAELLARIRDLHAQGLRPPAITRTLQADGWRSAHGKGLTEGSVRALLTRMGVVSTAAATQRRRGAACGRVHGD